MNHTEALTLAQRGQLKQAEEALTAALDERSPSVKPWIPVLEALARKKKDESTETLAWAMLDALQDQEDLRSSLAACGRLLRPFSNNDEFRKRAIELYRGVYSDVPTLERLIDISGLGGGKPIRRALQTLDIAVAIEPGAYLVHKDEGPAAKVVDVDTDAWSARIQTPDGEELFDVVTLGDHYELADEHNFRVLQQFDPDGLKKLLDKRPAELVLSLVQVNGNRMSSDQLELMLTPKYVEPEQWTKWWARVRSGLKKNPRVRLDGRNPVIIEYSDVEVPLEQELWSKFQPNSPPKTWLNLAQEYIRESKARSLSPQKSFILKLRDAAKAEAVVLCKRGDAECLAAWLCIGELTRLAGEQSDDAQAIALINKERSILKALAAVTDDTFWGLALKCVKKGRPQTYLQDYALLLPQVPAQRCDALVEQIIKNDQQQLLTDIVARILADPIVNLNGLCWLYLGPKHADQLGVPPLVTLVNKLLAVLEQVRDSQTISADTAREIRAQVRRTFAAQKFGRFKQCMADIGEGMADALRTQIKRCSGLSQAVSSDMLSCIRSAYPALWLSDRPRKPPWEDDSVLYCTARGRSLKDEELNEIINVKMKENGKAIGEAAALGDLSENSEYKAALEERDLLRARAAEIQSQLAIARVMTPGDVLTECVNVGTKVAFRNLSGGTDLTLTFLGPWEADVDNLVLNYRAPLSRRLMGLKVGDQSEFELGGHNGQFQVVSIGVGI